jgi:ketosteroid isomerase-like protein
VTAPNKLEIYRRAIEAFAERGTDGVAEFWDEDIDWRPMAGAPDDFGEIHGPVAMRRYLEDWLEMFDDLELTVHELHDVGGDRIVADQEIAGRAKISGAETRLRYGVLSTVRDGKWVHGREYATVAEALAAARRHD